MDLAVTTRHWYFPGSMADAPKKRMLVTGASGAIGAAIARACAPQAQALGLGYCNSEHAAQALAEELEGESGCVAHALQLDVTSSAAVDRAVSVFVERHGGVDAWVNNAGFVKPGLLLTSEEAELRHTLEVDLLGPMLCVRAVLPHMLRQRSGVILNVSSVAAVRPTRGQTAYAAAKGGLEAWTRALATEYAKKGIRAVGLRPGAIDTPMLAATREIADAEIHSRIPLRRLGSAEEVGRVAAFLVSDAAAYITGSIVDVDGGYGVG